MVRKARKLTFRELTPEQQEEFEKIRREWRERLRPYSEAIRNSRKLSAEDYMVRINYCSI